MSNYPQLGEYVTTHIEHSIIRHYNECYPQECCGLIVNDSYEPCLNISAHDNQFEIDPKDWVRCSRLGEIRAIVHSHPDGSTAPSIPDQIEMQHHGLPWIITNGSECAIHAPKDFAAPLLGRDYFHGFLDCYSLIKDYYQRELGINLGDYERVDRWWESPEADSLYLNNFKKEGFSEVENIQKHDIILCRVGRTEHINHACIFIGSGDLLSEETPKVIGDNLILHHPYNRQSLREVYGDQWRGRTSIIIRHKSLI